MDLSYSYGRTDATTGSVPDKQTILLLRYLNTSLNRKQRSEVKRYLRAWCACTTQTKHKTTLDFLTIGAAKSSNEGSLENCASLM